MGTAKRNKLAVIGMIGLILIIILALVGPLISKHDFAEQMSIIEIFTIKSSFLPFDGTVLMVMQKRKVLVWNRSTW